MPDLMSRAIEATLGSNIQYPIQELQTILHDSRSDGCIKSGTWSNKHGFTFGWISYFPNNNPQEDSIDASIDIKIDQKHIEYAARICLSSGDITAEIYGYNFEHNIIEATLSTTDQACKSALDLITPKMKELIAS